MLDELRRTDWVPRSVNSQSRKIAEAIQALEQMLGRNATDTEIAEKLEISIADYHQIIATIHSGRIIGIEDLGITEDVLQTSTDTEFAAFHEINQQQFQKALAASISALPEREALVLSLYYDQEFNLREIGKTLEVSESRVCQILSQAIHRLKAKLQVWQE